MKERYTLICGTNRRDAISLNVTSLYQEILAELGVQAGIMALHQLPPDFAFSALYENYGKNEAFNPYIELMLNTDKFVFVVPEYNGSFPGALKTFIDGLEYPNTFRNKKGALVGLASSGHGASLALSHLTDIFNFCGMHILAYKPRLERIEAHFEDGKLVNERYRQMLKRQASQFLVF
ncbi:MAG TPA: NAD(P)H-dependent oxidoreductase [Cyclobacteriaceae bacterium]|nr:NAD(P)H-dependent oxidoreductase [Cyclobacteriaceae bacterium]